MSQETVAVFGASGFVGSAFVERFMHDERMRMVPLIHSSGNAARLARHGLELRMADLLSPESIAQALRDCTAVVNCARGGKEVLTRGFQNLLDASLAAGIRRFVHVSSVAVYGDTAPGTILESRETGPDPNTYGAHKLTQDTAVKAAVQRGLSAVVICPPNISGPHSPFLLDIINTLRSGLFGLVDEGNLPCELVDVDNLVHAMHRGLDPAVAADGERIFVTDEGGVTWADLVAHLTALAEAGATHQFSRAEASRLAAAAPPPKTSLSKTLRHLLSSDVRDALRGDPLIARAELLAKQLVVGATPQQLQKALRRQAGGASKPRQRSTTPRVSIPLLRQQLRDVRYSTERSHEVLGYRPVLSFDQSMASFRQWYSESVGWNTPSWPLLKQLYT
jgi:nucleoside-diphosphate-sugar epimerase